MPPFLTGIAAKLIGLAVVAVIIAGLIGYVAILRADNAAEVAKNAVLQGSLDQQIKVNKDNLAALADMKASNAADLAAVAAVDDITAARTKTVTSIVERVNRAPATEEAAIAPVLLDAVAGLRQLAADPAAGADTNRAPDHPAGPAGLPGQAPGN